MENVMKKCAKLLQIWIPKWTKMCGTSTEMRDISTKMCHTSTKMHDTSTKMCDTSTNSVDIW
jgi:hypothetical protein